VKPSFSTIENNNALNAKVSSSLFSFQRVENNWDQCHARYYSLTKTANNLPIEIVVDNSNIYYRHDVSFVSCLCRRYGRYTPCTCCRNRREIGNRQGSHWPSRSLRSPSPTVLRYVKQDVADGHSKVTSFSWQPTLLPNKVAQPFLQVKWNGFAALVTSAPAKKQLWFLVHLAGIIEPATPVLDVLPKDLRQAMNVNCEAPYVLTTAMYDYMNPPPLLDVSR
jgi:hypothetical protein